MFINSQRKYRKFNLDRVLAIGVHNWNNRESILSELSFDTQLKFAIFCLNQLQPIVRVSSIDCFQYIVDSLNSYLEGNLDVKNCLYALYHNDDGETISFLCNNSISSLITNGDRKYNSGYILTYMSHIVVDELARRSLEHETKNDQMTYIRQLIVENLSEEDKDNWLINIDLC